MNTESRFNTVIYSVLNVLYYTGAVLSFLLHENTRNIIRLILYIYSLDYGFVILSTTVVLLVVLWYGTPYARGGTGSEEERSSPSSPMPTIRTPPPSPRLFIVYHNSTDPISIGVNTHPPR